MLTDEERNRFHAALNEVKSFQIGDYGYYDYLSDYHVTENSPGAHFGPAFYGWHKQYILR